MEDRLFKFGTLVEAGTYTKAATALHISQPALTAAINKLERELKAELLVRGHRPLLLTPAGHAAYRAATNLRNQANALKAELASLSGKKPTLALGVIDSIASALFVHGQGFATLGSEADLHISVHNSNFLLGALERDEIDCACVVGPREVAPSLTTLKLGDEPLVLVTSADAARETQSALMNGQLPRFLSYNQNSTTAQLIGRHLETHGVVAQAIFHSTSPEILLELAVAGHGAAVLPYQQVRALLRAGKLQPLAVGTSTVLHRPIIAVQRRGKRSLPVLAEARKQIAETLNNLATEARAV